MSMWREIPARAAPKVGLLAGMTVLKEDHENHH